MNKIKLTMTDELAEKNHRTLWNWTAETGKPKWMAPILESLTVFCLDNITDRILNEVVDTDCFACGEAYWRARNDKWRYGTVCCYCPIKWGNADKCTHRGSPYYLYFIAISKSEKKKYATIIANLPWKKRGE